MKQVVIALMLANALSGCSNIAPVKLKEPVEQDLRITLGGFIQGGDEHQQLDGTCAATNFRSALNCDIYNGLLDWRVTELVIRVTWSPYSDEDVRDFSQRVSIPPMTTSRVSFRLGVTLPQDTSLLGKSQTHWTWVIASAKGVPK